MLAPDSPLTALLLGPAAAPVPVLEIPNWKLLLIGLLLAAPLAASFASNLGLHRQLITGAIRCVVQLLCLGAVLRVLFTARDVGWVAAYWLFMVAVASMEASSRPSLSFKGMYRDMALSLTMPALVGLLYMTFAIIQPPVWYDPQYTVPLLGMLLGNSLNGVTIGIKSFLEVLSAERAAVEWALAMGATRYEAIWPLLQQVLQTALTPIINMLSVAGLVSIPGMMTGQILAGSDALTAAKYQILMLFGIGAVSTASCILAMLLALMRLTDSAHRLRLDRLEGRNEHLASLLWKRVMKASSAVTSAAAHVLCCCGLCSRRPPLDPSPPALPAAAVAANGNCSSSHGSRTPLLRPSSRSTDGSTEQ